MATAKLPRESGRYVHLEQAISELAPKVPALRYLEIGTFDGVRAARLLGRWHAETGKPWHYYGFDLFEQWTPQLGAQELSKSRPPPPFDEVHRRLSQVPGKAHLALFQGDTKIVLPRIVVELPLMDLIFVDGGHSLATVKSDWESIQRLMRPGHTIVLMDDYYDNRTDFGCRALVDSDGDIPPQRYRKEILDPADHYDHTGLTIRMVRIERVV